jgi:transketolase
MPTAKPLDTEPVWRAAREAAGIVTAGEATVAVALGGAVVWSVAQHPIKMKILGVPEFAPTGYLSDRYGMSHKGSQRRPAR